ncbi:MAG: PAS domain S-box protein [Chitinophagaceae bacterium]|nr:PAS domain S-box protein [Chitinophagaceae bacterium]
MTDKQTDGTEEKLRIIFDGVSDGIFMISKQGEVYSWNTGASEILGWSKEEATGRVLAEMIMPPRHREVYEASGFFPHLSETISGRTIDLPALTRDNRVIDISLRVSELKINNRLFFIGFIRKLPVDGHPQHQPQSFNKLPEKEMEGKSWELTEIFERVTDGFAALDKDCLFTYVNRWACQMFQRELVSLLGKCVWDIFPEAVGSATYIALQNALHTQRHTQSVDLYAPLGLWLEYNMYPSANGVSVFFKDITVQKKKEKEVAEARALADKLIDSLPGVFYFYDINGKFIRWNKQLEEVTGYGVDEIAGMHPAQLFPDDEKEKIADMIKTVFENGYKDIEADFLSKSGIRTSYYFKSLLIEYNGMPCLLGTGVDIAERKKSNERLKQSYEEIRELTEYLQKVREEERMRISHEIHDELGQLLTVLKMDVSWVNKHIPESNTEVKKRIAETLGTIDHTVRTVRRIASELRPALLDDLGLRAAMIWHIREFEDRTGIKAKVDLMEKDIYLSDDQKTSLYRILQESLTNVVRHSQAKKVNISLTVKDANLILTISDNGQGFDAGRRTLKTLGLLGMKERTLGMGGQYSIQSIPGKGTTVTVVLPVQTETGAG